MEQYEGCLRVFLVGFLDAGKNGVLSFDRFKTGSHALDLDALDLDLNVVANRYMNKLKCSYLVTRGQAIKNNTSNKQGSSWLCCYQCVQFRSEMTYQCSPADSLESIIHDGTFVVGFCRHLQNIQVFHWDFLHW